MVSRGSNATAVLRSGSENSWFYLANDEQCELRNGDCVALDKKLCAGSIFTVVFVPYPTAAANGEAVTLATQPADGISRERFEELGELLRVKMEGVADTVRRSMMP